MVSAVLWILQGPLSHPSNTVPRLRPFSSDWGFCQSRIIPKLRLGFLGTFHRTLFLYYGRQVSKVCYVMTTYGVEDSLVRAVVAKERNCVFLATVLDLVHYKEESGPIVMYCLLGRLPNVGKIVRIWVGGWI